MNIVLIGSIGFYDDMVELKGVLEGEGHSVALPPNEVSDNEGKLVAITEFYSLRKSFADEAWIWATQRQELQAQCERIKVADAVLAVNGTKGGVDGYVGPETLILLGIAFFLGKRLFLLNAMPQMDCREELLAMAPTVIEGDVTRMR